VRQLALPQWVWHRGGLQRHVEGKVTMVMVVVVARVRSPQQMPLYVCRVVPIQLACQNSNGKNR
jgi:hypothetical protein